MTAVVRRRWKHGHQRLSPRRIHETPWLRCLATAGRGRGPATRPRSARIGELTTVRRQPLPSKQIRACVVEGLSMTGAGRSTMQWQWLRRQYHLCVGLQKRYAPNDGNVALQCDIRRRTRGRKVVDGISWCELG